MTKPGAHVDVMSTSAKQCSGSTGTPADRDGGIVPPGAGPSQSASFPARSWTAKLGAYRKPDTARGTFELGITAALFSIFWFLLLLSVYWHYYFAYFILLPPAAALESRMVAI